MFFLHPVHRRDHIVLLAFALVVCTGARAGAAKIESQRRHIRVLESARGAENYFVVQSAAAEGMRMTDDGNAVRILKLAIKRFETAGAGVNIHVAKRLWIHNKLDVVARTAPAVTK